MPSRIENQMKFNFFIYLFIITVQNICKFHKPMEADVEFSEFSIGEI